MTREQAKKALKEIGIEPTEEHVRLWKQKCWRNRISFLHLPLI